MAAEAAPFDVQFSDDPAFGSFVYERQGRFVREVFGLIVSEPDYVIPPPYTYDPRDRQKRDRYSWMLADTQYGLKEEPPEEVPIWAHISLVKATDGSQGAAPEAGELFYERYKADEDLIRYRSLRRLNPNVLGVMLATTVGFSLGLSRIDTHVRTKDTHWSFMLRACGYEPGLYPGEIQDPDAAIYSADLSRWQTPAAYMASRARMHEFKRQKVTWMLATPTESMSALVNTCILPNISFKRGRPLTPNGSISDLDRP